MRAVGTVSTVSPLIQGPCSAATPAAEPSTSRTVRRLPVASDGRLRCANIGSGQCWRERILARCFWRSFETPAVTAEFTASSRRCVSSVEDFPPQVSCGRSQNAFPSANAYVSHGRADLRSRGYRAVNDCYAKVIDPEWANCGRSGPSWNFLVSRLSSVRIYTSLDFMLWRIDVSYDIIVLN
jgi:hypothetical protein